MIPQSDFAPIGSGAWEITYTELSAGVYVYAGDEPFGLVAYGFDNAVSYGYPGGMDISAAE